jgi:predicted CoA-binding protein
MGAKKTVDDLRAILTSARTIAVVGLSDKPERPAYTVPAYLQQAGYTIIPVNPTITEALGQKAYASLADIPEPVDVVQIFRRPEFIPEIVDQAIAQGAKVVWMQEGIVNEEAAAAAEAAGLTVVMDACMREMHQYFHARNEI